MTAPACRSCGAKSLLPVLDLGRTPLANALIDDPAAAPDPTYPLDVVFCPRCTLVQITKTIPPADLFGQYVYFSSFSDAAVAHARELAERMTRDRRLGGDSLVVEVASNDGYLLQHYVRLGVPVLGIDPAENVARVAVGKGVPTRTEFFGRAAAARLAAEGVRADVMHANNVLGHVPDLNGVAAGFAAVLKPGGVAVVEVPYVKDLIDRVVFDTIYHEHLSYFSLTALDRLFGRHGLAVEHAERIPIHGGSLRVFVGRGDPGPAARTLLREEEAWGVGRYAFYRDFRTRVEDLGHTLRGLLANFKRRGARLAAYGASAKGSTLLNYFGIGRETLDFVADRSTVKQGRYTPGTRLPIVSPDRLLADMPDYVLLLTWNFADEILAQQAEYRRRGGLFIIPTDPVRVV